MILVLTGSLLCVAAAVSAQAPATMWQPNDYEFSSTVVHENPFMVRFEATAKGPDGQTLLIPGFYDGGSTWKIRFSPTQEGEWTITTSSDDSELDGRKIEGIRCVPQPNPRIKGALRIDSEHPRHFVREDGSRFFLMGYECDWLWALDATNPNLPVANAFLDKLTDYGFNYIILNVYAHDTEWCKGHTEAFDYGPPPIYPWEGDIDNPDHSRLNLAFWQHFDRMIDAMHQRGIVAHIMTKVFNKMVDWPVRRSANDDLYYRTLIARYSAYPNVVWDFAKEAHGEGDFEYKSARISYIRENDPYKRLVTVHDDSASYDRGAYDNLADYHCDQQHERWHDTILAQRAQKEWPVVNVEFGYEHGPGGEGDHTYPVSQPAEEVIRRAWEIYTAGGYGAYYYTYTAWDIIHTRDTPPGYSYFRKLREILENTSFWLMEPDKSLISSGRCLARPGHEYIVFHTERREFTVRVEGCEAPLAVDWINVLSGKRQSAGVVSNGTHSFFAPEGIDGPLVLWLH